MFDVDMDNSDARNRQSTCHTNSHTILMNNFNKKQKAWGEYIYVVIAIKLQSSGRKSGKWK